ncbi:MAG: hypothetical protein A3B25_03325 [Candidatus Ryanbacteria bacterium RIFCSPLOWO2_01_FULL_48_26]|uniref:Uncharacterized protein n=1 Tax=Candidatus Ryanbacteria bacterium RIFCSPLOWO2_01_FULL_48_26 TaxID=1802126 RepID=A0A1G2GT59_9BACT|nr:MAG: hypothetical protein A3B25_03325 [Candidatus Ryanbacteria bacterium RIFCSPLOWO2_01_FULL_48_26]
MSIFGYKPLIPPRNSLGYPSSGFAVFARKYLIFHQKLFLRWALVFSDEFGLAEAVVFHEIPLLHYSLNPCTIDTCRLI